jgi:hypothetical protein
MHEELAFLLRDDSRRVLAAMLQQQQGVVDQLVDWGVADNADDSTHVDAFINLKTALHVVSRSLQGRQPNR